jgi:hypothetical protein
MFKRVAAIAIAVSLIATAASAMTVQEFLTTASHIPQQPHRPAALRHPQADDRVPGGSHRARRTDGRPRRRPASSNLHARKGRLFANEILGRFNAIPTARRSQISVTQAVREWMADRYPCPA